MPSNSGTEPASCWPVELESILPLKKLLVILFPLHLPALCGYLLLATAPVFAAIHNSYAQDDWVRWGSSDQTAASNMKGPEFRAGVGLGYNLNLIARLCLIRGIEKDLPTDVRNQTGKRFRIDLNWRF
jgi:hypothetical protein